MADPKQDESFKVIDRRLFSAEGEIRDEAIREERRKQETEPSAATPSPLSGQGDAAPPRRDSSAKPEAPQATQQPAPATGALKSSHGMQMLINFMAQNAAMLLGAYPDPRTGQPMLDLEGAREFIDMLDALREATRGNLAADDDRLLLDVLGSLKLSFMEVTKAAAKAMKEKAKARP